MEKVNPFNRNTSFKVTPKDVIKEVPGAIAKLGKNIFNAGKQLVAPVNERFQAAKESVQTKSFSPLKESFKKQGQVLSEQFVPKKGDTPQQIAEKGFNVVSSFSPTPKKPSKAIHVDDIKKMEEFVDNVRLKKSQNLDLELDASRIAEKYNLKMPKTTSGLANEFSKHLDEHRSAYTPKKISSPLENNPQAGFTRLPNSEEVNKGLDYLTQPAKSGTASPSTSKLIEAINQAKPIRKNMEAMYSAERSRRAGIGSEALNAGGEAGFHKALGALKGELPKPKFDPIRPNLEQADIDDLFNQVNASNLDFYTKINASNALSKLVSPKAGGIPTEGELRVLGEVFGSDLVAAIKSKRGTWEKSKEALGDIVNIPRSLMASFDMSAPLRQGVVFAFSHPLKTGKVIPTMIRSFGSDAFFKEAMNSIAKKPTFNLMRESNLYLADVADTAISLSSKEEHFLSNLASRIPIAGRLVKASERAYVGFLNKLRADMFDDVANQFQQSGITPQSQPEVFNALADFINTATGRGSLGPLNGAAPILNGVFFSPRLIASRFKMLNPVWYAKMPAPVRKRAVSDFLKFAGTGVGLVSLAKLAGADVEVDPRSTDFGKIKVGNTRYDIWGGFQQWTRLAAQVATGERKSTTSKQTYKLDKNRFPNESRLDVVSNFFQGKLAPIPALAADLLRGQSMIGEPVKLDQEAVEKMIPIYIQDIIEATKQQGPSAIPKVGAPAFFGVGTQTYAQPTKPGVKSAPKSIKSNPFNR